MNDLSGQEVIKGSKVNWDGSPRGKIAKAWVATGPLRETHDPIVP